MRRNNGIEDVVSVNLPVREASGWNQSCAQITRRKVFTQVSVMTEPIRNVDVESAAYQRADVGPRGSHICSGVRRVGLTSWPSLPVYPREQTSPVTVGTSQRGPNPDIPVSSEFPNPSLKRDAFGSAAEGLHHALFTFHRFDHYIRT